MRSNLSMTTVRGAMTILLSSNVANIIQAVGCTESDWTLLTGTKAWVGLDRPRVVRVLEGLMHGMIDMMGLPKFNLPAEYVAACVALFVNPINYFPACAWVGTFIRADDLSNYSQMNIPIEGFDRVTPDQLFALVCQICSGDDIALLSASFVAKSDISLGYVIDAK